MSGTARVLTRAQVRKLTRQPDFTAAQRTEHERLWRVLRAIEQVAEQDITPEEWLDSVEDYVMPRVRAHMEFARPWLERLFKAWDEQT